MYKKEPSHLIASKQTIEVRGTVEESLPGGKFRIRLESGQEIIGHLGGKLRMHRIHLLPGDQVRAALTPYDLTKGRIVYRF